MSLILKIIDLIVSALLRIRDNSIAEKAVQAERDRQAAETLDTIQKATRNDQATDDQFNADPYADDGFRRE